MTSRLVALAVALAAALTACAKNPVTGRRQLALVSTEQEIALGQQAAGEIAQSIGKYPDPKLQAYVEGIGKKLAAASERPELPWSFTVLDDPTVNAFALPGGPVFVTRGILTHMNSEAELAAVLAHEIAHVVLRHQLQAIQSSLNSDVWAGLGKDAAGQAIGRRGGDAFGLKSAVAGMGVDALKNGVFLRPLDRIADHDGSNIHQRVLAGVGRQNSLSESEIDLGGGLFPDGLPGQAKLRIVGRFGAWIPCGDHANRFSAVGKLEMRRHPDDIPQIDGRLQVDSRNPAKGHPVVTPVDHRFTDGPEPHVGIRDPLERLAVDRAG